jgi:cell wall-associated NlpC family hydrolase
MVGTGTIALSLGLGLFVGGLSAPQVASAAGAPVVTAAAAALPVPKMSQSVNRRTLARGQAVTLTVKLTDPKTGKAVNSGRVRLQAYRNGWKTWQTKYVRSGKVVFVSKPLITGSYRTVFLGSEGFGYAATKGIKVTVKSKSKVAAVIAEAKKHVGALYLYGASGPRRFDCSGFTMYVFKKAAGRKLPHKANSQQKYGKAIAKSKKQVGDLIVVRSGSYGYHVGIYAGNNTWYDSPRSGKRVSKRKIFSSNYVVRRLV